MAYNPDALYGQPVGAPAKLPTASLPSMNEPGQAPRREKVSAALKKLLQLAASIPSSYNDHNLGHFGIAATDDEYETKSNNRPHVPPANPGTGPTLPASTTQEQRDRLWLPSMIPVPKTSSADAAISAAQELIHALQHPHPASVLAPLREEEHKAALEKLSTDPHTA